MVDRHVWKYAVSIFNLFIYLFIYYYDYYFFSHIGNGVWKVMMKQTQIDKADKNVLLQQALGNTWSEVG